MYGKPQAVYHVAGKAIMVYRSNLLASVLPARKPNY